MKTRLFTRKRALISSVAMLLVAMIALGTATFAWFTANPNAKATGLSMKTTASAGLVIRTDSDTEWSHDAKLYKGQADAFNLTPVSEEQGAGNAANFWKTDAALSSEYGAKTDAAMTAANLGTFQAAGDVYSEKIYFRLSDGSNPADAAGKDVKLTSVSITKNAAATMEGTIRVAIANKAGTILGTYCISAAGANGTLTTASKTTGAFSPALATSVATPVVVPTTSLSADGADLSNYVTVYVYLDGQDSNCYSDKVGTVNATEIISKVEVSFTLA